MTPAPDPEALAALQARAYRHMEAWTAQDFAQMLVQPTTLLCHTDRAFCLGRVVLDEAEILALATDPAQQRQGHAARLMADFMARAQARGAQRLFLDVAEPNAAARAFYAAQGFAETGRRRGYYRQPDGTRHDALLLSRVLTQG